MLLDPCSFLGTATAVAYTTPVNHNFSRTADGVYFNTAAGTPDQPQQIRITNRMNFNGSSVITVKSTEAKNVAAVNFVAQKDDEIAVSIQISIPHRSFSQADILAHTRRAFSAVESYSAQLLRGEK